MCGCGLPQDIPTLTSGGDGTPGPSSRVVAVQLGVEYVSLTTERSVVQVDGGSPSS